MNSFSLRWLLIVTFFSAPSLFSSPCWSQTMTRSEIRRQYIKAFRMLRQNRYERASQLFFDIVENGVESPAFQRRARLQLARSLFRQDLHLVAVSNVFNILRNTPVDKPSEIFRNSLRGLISISETIGDESLIVGFLRQIQRFSNKMAIPPDQDPVDFLLRPRPKDKRRNWWPQLRNSFAYFMGRSVFLSQKRSLYDRARRFLKLVTPDARNHYHAKSLYLMGVMDAHQNKIIRSNKRFREVLAITSPLGEKDGLLNAIKEEAQYGIARNFYAQARTSQDQHETNPEKFKKETYLEYFRQTLVEYNRIPKHGKIFQDQVLFETAYTYFMMDQYHYALGQLLALNSPYYRTGFFPELEILRALIYFRTCKYENTKETVGKFLIQYQPLKKRLDQLYKNFSEKRWRAQYYDYYRQQLQLLQSNKPTDIPASVITVLSRGKELKNYEDLMKKIETERALIRGKSASWRESNIGKRMQEQAVDLLSSLRVRAGVSLYRDLAEIRAEVGRQLNQARFIQLETLQNQKKELERFAEGGGIEQDEIRYTIVTEQNYIYWPFQGEFWRDEIGYYRQFIQGECKR